MIFMTIFHFFVDYEFGFFALAASFGVSNQNKYDNEGGSVQRIVGDHWYDLHEGIVAFNFDTIAFSVGYNVHRDEIDSPYSLFISSRDIPALNAEFEFDNDLFFVTTRWVGLNFDSALPATTDAEGTLPDRGMNYRTFGFQIGDAVRVGYQEAIVYLNQYFNPLYFLAPLPAHFVQIFLTTPGSPFYTEPDPNTVLGVFFEYDDEIHYGYFQFLLDDISVSVTTKISWSLGYAIATDVGRFGIYHAGATRDTFQTTREDTVYPYTYVARNTYPTRSGDKTLWYFDNYIGYLYGENTLSFQITYENRFGPLLFEGGVEYVVSGDKSPTNPWHAATTPPGRVLLLNEDRLEHTIVGSFNFVLDLFEDLNFIFDGSVGYVFNELTLRTPSDRPFDVAHPIFVAGTESRVLFLFFLGVEYRYNEHTPEWRVKRKITQVRY